MKYFFISILFLQSCATQKPIKITEFSTYTIAVDTTFTLGKELVYYDNFFLVANYSDNNKTQSEIDSFVVNYISQNKYSAKTEEVRLWFYKETKKTNLVEIKKNPREIDRFSNQHDLVYGYYLKINNDNKREKYKKGNVIETTEKYIQTPKFKMKLIETY